VIPIKGIFPYFITLFPGIGHFYLQRHARALAYGLPFWGAVLLFFYIASARGGFNDFLLVLFFGGIALWLVCYIDSLITIQRLRAHMHAAYYGGGPFSAPYGGSPNRSYGQQPYAGYGEAPYQPSPYRASAFGNEDAYPDGEAGPSEGPGTADRTAGGMTDAPRIPYSIPPSGTYYGEPRTPYPPPPPDYDPERTKLIMMSFVPGLAHYHLGLMQRGMSTMTLFFGVAIFIFFVASMASDSFLAFLLALPVIWCFTLFDALSLYKRKRAGEPIVDQSFFEEHYQTRGAGRKNRTIATLLSIFPGAGHLYLGVQKRGIQLMAGFLISLYLLDVMRLSFFLFLIPIFWFFAFFDALQIISRFEREEMRDEPIINGVIHYQRWIGLGLLLMGLYYVFDQLAPNILGYWYRYDDYFWNMYNFARSFIHVVIVALFLIISGIVLLLRRKKSVSAPFDSDRE